MKFHKKGLLSLALSGLTFMSSFGAPSCQAMNGTCSMLDYLIHGTEESQSNLSTLTPWSILKGVYTVIQVGQMVYTFGNYAYKIYKIRQQSKNHMKFLEEVASGTLSDPEYVQRQEGPLWGWIATIQGILKKIKPECSMSQNQIYSLTHKNKAPACFEFRRNKKSYGLFSSEECDQLPDYSCIDSLKKISQTFDNSNLYPFNVINDCTRTNANDYKEIMKLLIHNFGTCFGITDPVAGNVDHDCHMVLLFDYDNNNEILKFEDPSYLKRYEMKLDKFAELCVSGELHQQFIDPDRKSDFNLIIIGFTNDPSKSGYYKVDFGQGEPKLIGD